jgi:hypothetical protein
MDWMQQLGGVLDRYTGGTADHDSAVRDYEHVATTAPRDTVAQGLAEAFRSDRTPAFAR